MPGRNSLTRSKSTQAGHEMRRVSLADPAYDTVHRFGWATDAAGLHSGCCMLRLRPADMIKFGELYLGGGVWQGKRILPAGWVETYDDAEFARARVRADVVRLDPRPTTATRSGWPAALGQLIAVVPEPRLVVAVGSVATATWLLDPGIGSFVLVERVDRAHALDHGDNLVLARIPQNSTRGRARIIRPRPLH